MRRDGSLVQNIVMDSEVKMFLLIRRVFFCMGYVLTQLLYVTELNSLLQCAIDDWFVNDRLAMVLEIAGTGRDDGLSGCEGSLKRWNGFWKPVTDGFIEQHLCTLPQVADSVSAVCRSMGFRSKTEQTS